MSESAEMLLVARDAELSGKPEVAAEIRAQCLKEHGRDWCRDCQSEIDPEWCWCGQHVDRHGYSDNHAAVPMGCRCGFDRSEEQIP